MRPCSSAAHGVRREQGRQRYTSTPWRAWYKTAQWQRLREEVFVRDAYICQRTGQLCNGRGNEPYAPVANHKKPHRGDPVLFWDINNIETVTKAVHDGRIQREERRGYQIGNGADGRPTDPNHPWNR